MEYVTTEITENVKHACTIVHTYTLNTYITKVTHFVKKVVIFSNGMDILFLNSFPSWGPSYPRMLFIMLDLLQRWTTLLFISSAHVAPFDGNIVLKLASNIDAVQRPICSNESSLKNFYY